MFDLPRAIGVSLILSAVVLQVVHVQEINSKVAAHHAEIEYSHGRALRKQDFGDGSPFLSVSSAAARRGSPFLSSG